MPGVQVPLIYQDVGGSDGNRWQTLKVHGSRDDQMPLLLNGMPFNNMNNTGGGYNHTLAINTGTVQEMTVTTSGSTAEAQDERRAWRTRWPRKAATASRFYFYARLHERQTAGRQPVAGSQATGPDRRSITSRRSANSTRPCGGPIVKDKLWFYGGFRYLKSEKYLAGSYYTKDPFAMQYCSQPAGCAYPIGPVLRRRSPIHAI